MDLRQAIKNRNYVTLSEFILEGHQDSVAEEGIVDVVTERFRSLFDKKEKEIHEEINHGDLNLNQIANIRSMLINKHNLKEDPSPVKLGVYSKWISLNGEIVDSAKQMIVELTRIYQLTQTFHASYLPTLNKLYSYIADTVLKEALVNPVIAIDHYEEAKIDFFPTQFRRILKKQRKGNIFGNITDVKGSDNYIGDWFVGTAGSDDELTKCRLDIALHYDLTIKKNKQAYLQPYSKEEIEEILVLIEEIAHFSVEMIQHEQTKETLQRLYFEMANLEKKYKRWDSTGKRSSEEIAAHDCIMITYNALLETDELVDAVKVFDHISRVVLKVCEHSVRRMI